MSNEWIPARPIVGVNADGSLATVDSWSGRPSGVRLTDEERNALTWADSTLMDSIDAATKTGNSEWANRSREAVFVIRRLIERLA